MQGADAQRDTLDRSASNLTSIDDKVDDVIRRATKHFSLNASLLQTAPVWCAEYDDAGEMIYAQERVEDNASIAAEASSASSDGDIVMVDAQLAHEAMDGRYDLVAIEALGEEYEYIGFDYVEEKVSLDCDDARESEESDSEVARKRKAVLNEDGSAKRRKSPELVSDGFCLALSHSSRNKTLMSSAIRREGFELDRG